MCQKRPHLRSQKQIDIFCNIIHAKQRFGKDFLAPIIFFSDRTPDIREQFDFFPVWLYNKNIFYIGDVT